MTAKTNDFGFVACTDLINGQKYGAALKTFQQAVANFLDARPRPNAARSPGSCFRSVPAWKKR